MRIRLDKIDGFIRIYNGTRYLILFGSETYDDIYNRIRYLINHVLNKFRSHYYYKIFLEEFLYQIAKNKRVFFDGIIMLRFGETKIANFILQKKQ